MAQRVGRGIALLFHDRSTRRGLDDVQCLIHNESHFTDVQQPEIFVVISAVLLRILVFWDVMLLH